MSRLTSFVAVLAFWAHLLPAQVFPSRIPTDRDLLVAVNNSSGPKLVSSMSPTSTSFTVTVNDAHIVPNMLVTIDKEVIQVCSVSGTTITVCSGGRGFRGSEATSHYIGSRVEGRLTEAHHNVLSDLIKEITTSLGVNLGNVVKTSEKGAADGVASLDDSGKVPLGQLPSGLPSTATWGLIEGTLADQADLKALLDAKQASLGFTPENAAAKGQANGYASLGSDGKVPTSQLPALASGDAEWGSITGSLADQSDLAAELAAKAALSHGHAVSDVTGLQAALDGKQAALGYTPQNAAQKNQANGYAGLDASSLLSSSQVPSLAISKITGLQSALDGKQFSLGFTPENAANKNQVDGYAGLDGSGLLSTSLIPNLAVSKISGLQGALDGKASSSHLHAISDVSNLQTALDGKQASLGFTAENSANKGQVNGYASLGSDGKVPAGQLPAMSPGSATWGDIEGTLSDQTDLAAALAAKAALSHSHATSDVTGLQAALDAKQASLGFTPEDSADKNQPSGYAGLDGSGLIAGSQVPALAISKITGLQAALDSKSATGHGHAISDVSGLQAAIDGKQAALGFTPEDSADKGQANGYAALDSDGKVPASQLPALAPGGATWGAIDGDLDDQADLVAALAAKQNALGFTPENAAQKNQANGYAGLDASSLLNTSQIPSLAISKITGLQAAIDGKSDTGHGHAISDVSGLQTALDGKQASLGFTAENSANKNQVDGYAGLDESGLLSVSQVPSLAISKITGLQAALDGKSATGHGHAIDDVSGLQSAIDDKQASLGFTPENVANKAAANGYASLDASTKIPIAQLPTGTSSSTVSLGNHSHTKADIGLGNVENTALSTWTGSANITAIGTLASGSVPWARLTSVPSTFAPSAHASSHISTGSDAIAAAVAGGASGLMTGADKTKLNGIATGAEVNVNADWNSGSGDSQILNKPTLRYQTVQDEGSALTQQAVINFLGSGVTCVNDSANGRTNCTINAGSVSAPLALTGSSDAIQLDLTGHSTQTNPIMRVRKSDGTVSFQVNGDGSVQMGTGTGPQEMVNVAAPSGNPATGSTYFWMDSTNKIGKTKDDAGNISVMSRTMTANAGQFVTGIGSDGILTRAALVLSDMPTGVSKVIASGTATLGTSAIAAGQCATAVTVSASGVATTDVIDFNPNASVKTVTGFAPGGGLSIRQYPTANNVNFEVCNETDSSKTPGSAVTLNWHVTR